MKRAMFLISIAIVAATPIISLLVFFDPLAAAVSSAGLQIASISAEVWALLVLTVLATSLAGLLVLATQASRIHWFWRLSSAIGWLLLMRAAHAPELLLLFAGEFIAAGALLVVHRALRRRADRRSDTLVADASAKHARGWQFSLRDVLLWMLLAGLCMPLLHSLYSDRIHEQDEIIPLAATVTAWLVLGFACGGICCLAAWAVAFPAPRRRPTTASAEAERARRPLFARLWLRTLIGLLAAVALSAATAWACHDLRADLWLTRPTAFAPLSAMTIAIPPVLVGLWIVQTVWLGIWRLSGWQRQAPQPDNPAGTATTSWSRGAAWVARVLLGTLLSVATVMLGVVWWALARSVPNPPDVPEAEHEARLVEIGGQMIWGVFAGGDPDAATPQEAATFVDFNSDRLAEVHDILAGPCGAKVDYLGVAKWSNSFAMLRNLARSFGLQSRTAFASGDYPAATRAAIDCFRVGSRGQHGGKVINQFVAHAVEDYGVALLIAATTEIDREAWQELDSELSAMEQDRESLHDIYAREYAETMNANGWFGRLAYPVERLFGTREAEPYRDVLERSECRIVAQLRLLRASLAIRFYRQDEGNFPQSLAALVPNWLDAVPVDPYSGQPLVYRADDEGYSLYSVGPNGIDDGGRAVIGPESADDGDLSLERFRLEQVMQAEEAARAAAEAAERARQQAETAARAGEQAETPDPEP